jgi:D-alanine-D-alanine ligase-like ATP-grasp enzyme
VGNKLVAAARRDPPLVIGNGKNTVRELVEQVNADPRRGEGHATSLTKIRLDDIAKNRLKEQGLDENSVPAKGTRVILRNNANLSTGPLNFLIFQLLVIKRILGKSCDSHKTFQRNNKTGKLPS